MSYCRWSSDCGECDVYTYEDVYGGWTTHVAGRRLKHKVPDEIKAMPLESVEDWIKREDAVREWRESLPCDELPCTYIDSDEVERPGTHKTPKDSEYIDLGEISDHAGKTYNDPTPGACADRLEEIRESGLNVPQSAIDVLREEQRELTE